MTELPYLERVKIQSEILLPLYRRLREELGSERASAMLRAAVREYAEALGQRIGAGGGSSLEKLERALPAFSADGALDIEPVARDAGQLAVDVRRCAYAEYFHGLGEPEFGAMLTCEIDPPMTRGIGSDLELERTETIMQGAARCDFRWKQGA
ncbi:MAG: L-2-amino-thiazoline-4-carboxylic acid hydrolase [Gammaproteobacteria bacterium]